MNIIPITKNCDPVLNWSAMHSVLYYPNEPEKRKEFLMAHTCHLGFKFWSEEAFKDRIDPFTYLKTINYASSYNDFAKDMIKRGKDINTAGNILVKLLWMERNENIKEPSIRKAVALLMDTHLKQKEFRKAKFQLTAKGIRNCWDEFKNVSHLWAAYYYKEPSLSNSYSKFSETFSIFLGVAEYFRNFAISTIQVRSKTPILKAEEAWKVPEDFPVPEITDKMISAEYGKDAEKFIKNYSVENIF
jgi:hypothetical protein